MKKLLHKRVLIPLAVVAVMAIGAVAAYAFIVNTVPVASGNAIGSGNMTANVRLSPDPITASNLMPSLGKLGGGSYQTVYFGIQNTSTDPAYFRVQANLTGGDPSLADDIDVMVTLQPSTVPGGWTSGTYGHSDFVLTSLPIKLSSIVGNASVLNNVQPLITPGYDPLLANMWAVYRIDYWLNSSVTTGGKSLTFDLNAHITQAVDGNSQTSPGTF